MQSNSAPSQGVKAEYRSELNGLVMRLFFGPQTYKAALLLIASFSVVGVASAADAGSCYGINDMDARTWCLAKAHGDPGQCYSIQNSATRSMCLVEVRK
jgi:hypothetical protein